MHISYSMTLAIGIKMIYFIPLFSTRNHIRRFGSLVLVLPICVLLTGCDNRIAPYNGDDTSSLEATADDNTDNTVDDTATVNTADNQDDAPVEAIVDEGTPLISAAKPASQADEASSLSPLEGSSDNMLQATLIGDYIGILPCSFCESTQVTLNLFSDGSVVKTSIYSNPNSPKVPLVESGVYRQDSHMITIAYTNQTIESYRIQDNHLVMMSEDKTAKPDYTLSRK